MSEYKILVYTFMVIDNDEIILEHIAIYKACLINDGPATINYNVKWKYSSIQMRLTPGTDTETPLIYLSYLMTRIQIKQSI